jgi:hypothetical protein
MGAIFRAQMRLDAVFPCAELACFASRVTPSWRCPAVAGGRPRRAAWSQLRREADAHRRTLDGVATPGREDPHLVDRFEPLRDHGLAQVAGDADDRAHDGIGSRFPALEVDDEGAIDLERVAG